MEMAHSATGVPEMPTAAELYLVLFVTERKASYSLNHKKKKGKKRPVTLTPSYIDKIILKNMLGILGQ